MKDHVNKNKAIDLVNKLIVETDKQPQKNKSFRYYTYIYQISRSLGIEYDLKSRISKEYDIIENYLNNLPDSSFADYNEKIILSKFKKGHSGGIRSSSLEIKNPEQAELLLLEVFTPRNDIQTKEWYRQRISNYYPKTTKGAKNFASTLLNNNSNGDVIAKAEYILRFSSNIPLDSYWLANRVKHDDKETRMYLFRKTLEYDPASVYAAVSAFDIYVDWEFHLDAEKTCLNFLSLPSEAFDSREFPESSYNNSYKYETEFLSKMMIYYKLTRLYAYYWDSKEKDAKKVVKKWQSILKRD